MQTDVRLSKFGLYHRPIAITLLAIQTLLEIGLICSRDKVYFNFRHASLSSPLPRPTLKPFKQPSLETRSSSDSSTGSCAPSLRHFGAFGPQVIFSNTPMLCILGLHEVFQSSGPISRFKSYYPAIQRPTVEKKSFCTLFRFPSSCYSPLSKIQL